MKFRPFLALIIIAASFTSFAQEKQSRKAKKNTPVVEEKGLIKVSVMYPFSEGKKFEMEYYETMHMPMVAGYLGENLVKYTIEKGVASGIPNQPLPYTAIGTFYVRSLSDYQAAIGPNRDAIRADILKYTDIAPIILISEVVR